MGLVGQPVARREDRALLTGRGRFTDDLPAHAVELCFVRATVAHARLRSVHTAEAEDAPGVVGVFVAADFERVCGVSPLPIAEALIRPILAAEVVRFAGEIIAVVAAQTAAEAQDAAELVVVEYEPLPVAASLDTALDERAPVLFESLDSNRAMTVHGAPSGSFADDAELVVELEMVNQRVGVVPLETNAVLAVPDGDGLVVSLSTQTPHAWRDFLAEACDLDPGSVRVVAPCVGGAFGAKSMPDPEYVLAALLALRLGCAVRWRQTRSENLRMVHGRGQRQRVRVAARADGRLLRIHADLQSDDGAYPGMNHFLSTLTAAMLAGTYRFDDVTASLTGVATNTAPTVGYRGAGRPEAASLVERVVDIVAAELGLDPAEIRRRNFIGAGSFPYTTPTGAVYDSGDYRRALDRALAVARYEERRAEQAARRAANDRRLLGIGIGCYVEVTAGMGATEFADVVVHADERATVRVGTFAHGQGHRTTYAQIAADVLGLPLDAITVIDGDTGLVARGVGTYGSRSMQVGGSAVNHACIDAVEAARAVAADLLEAAVEDIVHDEHGFGVAGVPAQRAAWSAIVRAATESGEAERDGIRATVDWERQASTYPFGAHVAVVEVDAETGAVRLVEHIAVDDCGNVLNPMIADGQVQGGIAQGAAQALFEEIVYDEAGNVLTSNLADYCCVSAAELPTFTLSRTVTPTPLNPLGVKGIGESGTIGSMPAVHNAVIDALAHLGVRHVEMPCTPERVWRALNGERHARVVAWRR